MIVKPLSRRIADKDSVVSSINQHLQFFCTPALPARVRTVVRSFFQPQFECNASWSNDLQFRIPQIGLGFSCLHAVCKWRCARVISRRTTSRGTLDAVECGWPSQPTLVLTWRNQHACRSFVRSYNMFLKCRFGNIAKMGIRKRKAGATQRNATSPPPTRGLTLGRWT